MLTLPCPASSRVRSLIQATLGCLPVQDFALNQDTQKIFRAVTRLSKCRHILTSAAHPQPPYTAHIHGRVLCTTATRCCMWRGPFSAAVCGEGLSLLLCVERALLCCCMWRGPFSAAVCGEGPSLLLHVERALLCCCVWRGPFSAAACGEGPSLLLHVERAFLYCCMWRGPFSAAVCGEGPSLLLHVERTLLCCCVWRGPFSAAVCGEGSSLLLLLLLLLQV